MERVARPANELEGLIRDRLPDAVRRRLTDVIIERSEGQSPTGPLNLWSGHLSHHDKRVFIRALFEVRRDHLLLTDDQHPTPVGLRAVIIARRTPTEGHALLARAWQAANDKARELGQIV